MTNKIEKAENGYIFTIEGDAWSVDKRYVATTLTELAKIVEPDLFPNTPDYVHYANGSDKDTLREVRELMLDGQKIPAIKLLRSVFSSNLSLREAKDMVEVMIGK